MKLVEVSRGISHIEDLPPAEIVEVLSNLRDYAITEKVDGAQLLFGIDINGFYTSRESKGGERIYNEGDYGIKFSSTYIRSAHKLLEQMLPALKGAGLKLGDQVEAEVLYGEMPNVVPYSADINYLIFLRTTEGTVNIDRLHRRLDGHETSVSLVSPFTDDGRTIELQEETNTWKFSRVPLIEKKDISASLKVHLGEMKKFLEVTDPVTKQPYGTILEVPLNKIPAWVMPGTWKEVKEHIKEKRTYIQGMLEAGHIIPIKEVLLNYYVRNTASSFGPLLEDGGWIEGVVLRNASTGKMVKIIDKDIFGKVREAAWQKRNMLTERAKGVDSDAGFMGRLYLDMARSIGHPELGTYQARNYLRKTGVITEDKLDLLTEGVDFGTVKSYWGSLLEIRYNDLNADLDKYEKEVSENYVHHSVVKRTHQTYATILQEIVHIQERTISSLNTNDLLQILVGKQLGKL